MLADRTILSELEAWIASAEGQRYACTKQYPNPACDRNVQCVGCLMVAAALELKKAASGQAGILQVGLTHDETMVVLNHPQIDQDERGGHIIFTPQESRHLGEVLIKKAGECRATTGSTPAQTTDSQGPAC